MKIIFQEDDGTLIKEATLDEAEVTAAEVIMNNIPDWTLNAIQNRSRQAIDKIVTESGLGSEHTDVAEKKNIIGQLKAQGKAPRARDNQL